MRSQRGEISAIAKRLAVSHTSVSLVLKGTVKSARLYAACERRALEILEERRPEAGAA